MNISKKITLWIFTIFLSLFALSFVPSFASIPLFLAAALLVPIHKWQHFLRKYIHRRIKNIAVIGLAFVALLTAPADDTADTPYIPPETTTAATVETTEAIPETAVIVETTIQATSASTTEAATAPSTAPTSAPTSEAISWPTSEITYKPTIAPTTQTVTIPLTTVATEVTSESTTAPSTESIHTHNFTAATCTTPKTCSYCSATDGSAAGHNWVAATCTTPKTCSSCGITEGSAIEHNYVSGKCSSCGENDPDYVSEAMVWIPTKGGKKYHSKSSCSGMIDPIQVTKTEAINQGFTACGRCY